MSINKNKKADLSESWVFLWINIKYKLLNIPKKTIKFDVKKSNWKFKKKYTKFTAINWPEIPIHLKVIYVDFLKEWYFEVWKNFIFKYQDFEH